MTVDIWKVVGSLVNRSVWMQIIRAGEIDTLQGLGGKPSRLFSKQIGYCNPNKSCTLDISSIERKER